MKIYRDHASLTMYRWVNLSFVGIAVVASVCESSVVSEIYRTRPKYLNVSHDLDHEFFMVDCGHRRPRLGVVNIVLVLVLPIYLLTTLPRLVR